jgi:hypothetical protein
MTKWLGHKISRKIWKMELFSIHVERSQRKILDMVKIILESIMVIYLS